MIIAATLSTASSIMFEMLLICALTSLWNIKLDWLLIDWFISINNNQAMVDEVSHDAFRYIWKNLCTLDISW